MKALLIHIASLYLTLTTLANAAQIIKPKPRSVNRKLQPYLHCPKLAKLGKNGSIITAKGTLETIPNEKNGNMTYILSYGGEQILINSFSSSGLREPGSTISVKGTRHYCSIDVADPDKNILVLGGTMKKKVVANNVRQVRRIAAIFVNFMDDRTTVPAPSTIVIKYFNDKKLPYSITNIFSNNSYGRVEMQAVAHGWIELPYISHGYCNWEGGNLFWQSGYIHV
jgi:hypothetical protein